MSKNEFQEYVIDTLEATIKMCKERNISKEIFSSYGSRHALKIGLISHFASMYKYNNQFKNLWQNTQIELCSPLLKSKKALDIVQKVENDKVSYTTYKKQHKNEPDKLLYWEHIIPNDTIWNHILNVFDNYSKIDNLRNAIENCLMGHRLILITKKEAEQLDKKGGRSANKLDIIKNCNIIDIKGTQITKERIKLLFDEEYGVESLHLGKNSFNKSSFNDEAFPAEVQKYFSNEYRFII